MAAAAATISPVAAAVPVPGSVTSTSRVPSLKTLALSVIRADPLLNKRLDNSQMEFIMPSFLEETVFLEKRSKFLTDLLRQIFNTGGVIFGGFVRDFISHRQFADIDVRFLNTNSLNKFVDVVFADKGYETTLNEKKVGYHAVNHWECCLSSKEDPCLHVKLDLILDLHSERRVHQDFDVNQLTMSTSEPPAAPFICAMCFGIRVYIAAEDGLELDTIVANIKTKSCVYLGCTSASEVYSRTFPCDQASCYLKRVMQKRVKKMQTYGWNILNLGMCKHLSCVCVSREVVDAHNQALEERRIQCQKSLEEKRARNERLQKLKSSTIQYGSFFPSSALEKITVGRDYVSFERHTSASRKEAVRTQRQKQQKQNGCVHNTSSKQKQYKRDFLAEALDDCGSNESDSDPDDVDSD